MDKTSAAQRLVSRLTVEELDDVGEVHVVLQDDVAVQLHQRQRDEQHEVLRGGEPRGPDGLPQREHVVIHHFWNNSTQSPTSTLTKHYSKTLR